MENNLIIFITSSIFSFLIGFTFSNFFLKKNNNNILINKKNSISYYENNKKNNINNEDSDDDFDEKDLGKYKLILVVRNDLGMTKGKIAAQVGHATIGAYKKSLKKYTNLVKKWEKSGQAKVAVKIQSEKEMLEIEKKASELGICTFIVIDAGRTQIEAGSKTVLAIGPDLSEKIDKITKHLKLL